jgi:AhpD family alkylhydroperoxidase
MDRKTEEMIALGVSYGINCKPCMEYHKKQALEAGLTAEQMQAAIQIAEQVKKGAASKTQEIATELFGEIKDQSCCPSGSECCP